MLIRGLCPADSGWWWKCRIQRKARFLVSGWCDCSGPFAGWWPWGAGGQEAALAGKTFLLVWAPNAVPHLMSFGFGPHHPLQFLLNLYYTCLGWFSFCSCRKSSISSSSVCPLDCPSIARCSENTSSIHLFTLVRWVSFPLSTLRLLLSSLPV